MEINVKRQTFDLHFQNVNYRDILHNISGHLTPGEILVIMGPSGAGKTTLMNILAGRLEATGTITVNGDPKIMKYKRSIAYVTQDDLIFSSLTVRQNLEFTAKLKLPKSNKGMVTEVISKLGLDKCADSPLGGMINVIKSDIRGVSGGERKRTIIGNAMLTDPMLIFLDEPTSGLDSSSALSLFKTIKDLATEGRTIVLTLHQPSSELFSLFDKLLLLVDGYSVYYGPARDMMDYFFSLGYYCNKYYNPADFLMKLLTNDASKQKLIEQNFQPELKQKPDLNSSEELNISQEGGKFILNWFEQVKVLTQRQLILNSGSVDLFGWVQVFILGIIIGLLWFHLDLTDQNVPLKNAVLIISLLFVVGMTPIFLSIISFPIEKIVLKKERLSGLYQLSAYYVAKRLSELPFETIPVLLYCIPVYWLVWFRQDAYFLVYLGIMLTTYYTSSAMGLIFGAIFTNIKLALLVMTILTLVMILSSGFYIPISHLPEWIRWVNWISYFKYSYNALIYAEYTGRNIKLAANSTFFTTSQLASFGNVTHVSSNEIFSVLELNTNLWINCCALFGFFLIFHLFSYISILIFCN